MPELSAVAPARPKTLMLVSPPVEQPPTFPKPWVVEDRHRIQSSDDLFVLARHLAREVHYRPGVARSKNVAWYREQVGEDLCTQAQAMELRWLTMDYCACVARGESWNALQLAERGWVRAGAAPEGPADGIWLLLVVAIVFGLGWLAQRAYVQEQAARFDHAHAISAGAR